MSTECPRHAARSFLWFVMKRAQAKEPAMQTTTTDTRHETELDRLIRVERDRRDRSGLVASISQRVEQDAAWLGMLAYAAMLPVLAIVGFVFNSGLF